jgi:hypothetical protein
VLTVCVPSRHHLSEGEAIGKFITRSWPYDDFPSALKIPPRLDTAITSAMLWLIMYERTALRLQARIKSSTCAVSRTTEGAVGSSMR